MDPTKALLTVVAYFNTEGAPLNREVVLPVREGRITSEYGVRTDPVHGAERFHEGIDIGAVAGSPIYAVAEGQVIFSGYHAGFGRVLAVRHSYDITTLYAHCWATRVAVGERVQAGTIIGFVGNTGRATGPHLHFEVRVRGKSVDPFALTEGVKSLRQHR